MAGCTNKLHSHKAFLLCNYLLLGLASSCIFLTLSLRLLPSPCGLLLLFLHALTAVAAAASCSGSFTSPAPAKWHAAHTAGAALTAIFQGAMALLAFTRTADFLGELQSYVQEEDAAIILKMVGGLGTAIFVLEWAALALAFVLRFDDGEEGGGDKMASDEPVKNWPWQV